MVLPGHLVFRRVRRHGCWALLISGTRMSLKSGIELANERTK